MSEGSSAIQIKKAIGDVYKPDYEFTYFKNIISAFYLQGTDPEVVEKILRELYNQLPSHEKTLDEIIKLFEDIYLGDDEKATAQGNKSIYRDSIQLPKEAFAVGRDLRSLPFSQLKVGLIGIRRGTKLIKKPEAEFVLIENDVVLVIGLPANVEQLKHVLLGGKEKKQ